ncbi:MAG: AGE family epimerase/isomerase [Bacteroidales bacterium]|nr:AGE family epimerase/isomerase [Bacteroidales bacterium]
MITGQFRRLKKELEQELESNILSFWMKYTPDHAYGGFHGHVTHFNQTLEKANKGAIMNARILWTFAAAYRMYGEQAYLETAERAYQYIQDYFMDRELGGVFWELDYKGEVANSRKQIYAIAFVIYAMTEYRQACGNEQALKTAITLFEEIEAHALDPERNGYTEALARDWTPVADLRLSEKDDNESKTMNTHLHILEAYTNLYRVWKDHRLERALKNIIVLFIEKFVDPETHHLNLFFDDDWNLKSSLISYGHDIECSWLLHEAAEVLGQSDLIEKTEQVAVNMARKNFMGLDSDHGLFYELFPLENRLDTDKHWWPQAEAMVGYFNAFQLSGDEEFARKTINSWKFIQDKIIDRKYGEWYWSVNREGKPNTEKEKAGFWKCPYHNGRACMELSRRIESC